MCIRDRLFRLLRRTLLVLVGAVAALVALRAWESQRGPPLELWHTYVPNDLHAADIDKMDWASYLRHEESILSMSAACRSWGT